MKQTLFILLTSFALIISCERNDEPIKEVRNSFLVVGDTLNCKYVDFNPDILFDTEMDSFDINFDNKFDVEFIENSVFIDDCEEVWENCPPDAICDCWPIIYTDYIINMTNNTEIVIDKDSTLHEFYINDTISKSNIWTRHTKYPMYHRTLYDTNWSGFYELILGLRKIQNPDTLYSWLSIRIENSVIIVKELAIQK